MKKTIIILIVALLAVGGYMMFGGKNESTKDTESSRTLFETSDDAMRSDINNNGTVTQNANSVSSQSKQSSPSKANSTGVNKPSAGVSPVTINNLNKLENDFGTVVNSQDTIDATIDESIEFELRL